MNHDMGRWVWAGTKKGNRMKDTEAEKQKKRKRMAVLLRELSELSQNHGIYYSCHQQPFLIFYDAGVSPVKYRCNESVEFPGVRRLEWE